MIVTTTTAIESKRITRYCGVVAGEAILGAGNGMLMASASGTAVIAE